MSKLLLIVDDEPIWRRVLGAYFERHGFRTRGAADGREALAAARAERPDLVVLDVAMPEMDGLAFLRAVRAEDRLSGIPVVVSSARTGRDVTRQTAELGVRHHLVKAGHSMGELLGVVKGLLADEAADAGPTAAAA